jgi:hypothetical protein
MDSTSSAAERRSTRIRAQIPLRLSSVDFSERCSTLVVNTTGCGVRLSRALEAGTEVKLDELPTGMEVNARVANCVPIGSEGKYWIVGLALEQGGNIWGIKPVPADWEEESKAMAAAASASIPAQKKNEWPYNQFSRRGEFHPGRK